MPAWAGRGPERGISDLPVVHKVSLSLPSSVDLMGEKMNLSLARD